MPTSCDDTAPRSSNCTNELFTRRANQVFAFENTRNESLEEVKKELVKREKRGEVGEEERYTGDWEVLSEEDGVNEIEKGIGEDVCDARGSGPGVSVSRHTKVASEEAAEAGRGAAEVARILDEWQMGD